MSRCFPFPPPGYEKKLTTDEPDLLKKKKRKEKKHKKDKEKKDSKEKREKDRSEGKQKDKKDKNRDKKKDKEKSKTITPDEKRNYGQIQGYNGDLFKNSINFGETDNFKFVEELDRRIRDEEKGTSSHHHQHQFVGRQAVSNRINGATTSLDNKVDRSVDRSVDRKDRKHEKGSDDKRKNKDREKERHVKEKGEKEKNKLVPSGNSLSTKPSGNSFRGVGCEGNLKKRKDIEMNGVSHENEPKPNKMARPVSNISQENGTNLDFLQNPCSRLLDKHVASLSSFKVSNNDGQKVNGPVSISAEKSPISAFNHVPSKPAPIKSPPVITNHIAAQSPPVSTTKPQPNHIATYHQLPPLSSPSPPTTTAKPPPGAVNKAAAPPRLPIPKTKPPHPDTKYLTQILSVPKLDPWSGFDDQEWLFGNKTGRPVSKKPTMEDVEVWSEAKHIECVDICALPYVIPY